jgi:DNA-binding transcriptional LysR family regulator
MTFNQLNYFYQAARLQHYRQAAELLNISESSLSRSITAIEDELGVRLFDKRGRNVELTRAGKVFLTYTEKILTDVDAASTKMHELATDGAHINIAYVSPLARSFIPKTVKAFLTESQNKNVVFNFFQDITERNIERLKTGSCDLAFGSYIEDEPSIEFVPIQQQDMVIIMSNKTALSVKPGIDIRIFDQYPVLSYDLSSGLGRYTSQFFQKHGLNPDIICSSPDENGIASLVAEGFGIALVADVDEIHRPGITIRKLPPEYALSHTVYLCYQKDKYMLPALRRLVDFVRLNSY